MDKPFFSIIIVAYNAEKIIKKTIDSVLCQKFDDYEIIVKDAQSLDKTLNCVPKSDKIKVYSTVDKGIYDGMNEAIDYASGKYLYFLNCGDYFENDNVLDKIYQVAKDYDSAVIYGDFVRNGVVCCQPSKMSLFTIYRSALCHQTMFFSKNLFYDFGKYDLQYKIKADYDFTVKTVVEKVLYVHVPVVVCVYEGGGVSEQHKEVNKREEKSIYKTHFSKWQRFKFSFVLFFTFRKLRQKLMSDKSPKWLKKLYRKIVNKINK